MGRGWNATRGTLVIYIGGASGRVTRVWWAPRASALQLRASQSSRRQAFVSYVRDRCVMRRHVVYVYTYVLVLPMIDGCDQQSDRDGSRPWYTLQRSCSPEWNGQMGVCHDTSIIQLWHYISGRVVGADFAAQKQTYSYTIVQCHASTMNSIAIAFIPASALCIHSLDIDQFHRKFIHI